jgi:hypothetical protein
MPPPSTATVLPCPEFGAAAIDFHCSPRMGINPSHCIALKAALYPPICPTRARKSRLVKPMQGLLELGFDFFISAQNSKHPCGVTIAYTL